MSRGDFWSRRQAAVAAEAEAETQAAVAAQSAARDAEVATQSDEEILAALNLPDPETLQEGDDFKVFLREEIPARIKTRALRHLWRANPVLACVDGLVDYGEDFTDASCVIEGLQTAYQVGKGMTKHVEALAEQAEAERVAVAKTAPPTAEAEAVDVASSEGEATPVLQEARALQDADATAGMEPKPRDTATLAAAQADLDPEAAQPGAAQIPTAPRRMRFSFAEAQT